MSKDIQDQDHPCNKLTNSINEDELLTSCKMQLLDNSHSSENVNNDDKLNLSYTNRNNNFKTSTLLTSTDDVSDKKLIGSNVVHESRDLNEIECNVLIDAITNKKDKTDINSQEEKLLEKILMKNKNQILPTNIDLDTIDTQQYMDLNFCVAVQQLKKLSSPLNLDSSKTQNTKQIDSDNSTITSPLPLIQELKSPEIKNKNAIITVNDSNKSENVVDSFGKIDLKFIQDQYVELSSNDQDAEIIAFRTMCEELLKIGANDNNIVDDNKIIVNMVSEDEISSKTMIVKENNQINNLVIKQVNNNIINNIECKPSTSKLYSPKNSNFLKGANCSSKSLALKRKFSDSTLFQYEEDDCMLIQNPLPKVNNDLKCKKINDDPLEQKKLSIENQGFDYYSRTGKVHQDMLNYLKKKKLPNSTLFQNEEDDCMLIDENPLLKVKNEMKYSKCKKINSDTSKQNKLSIENQGFDYYSPTGKVHQDMLNYIKQKDCHWF